MRCLYAFLTTADRELVEHATGEDVGGDAAEAPVVAFALHIARDREAEVLKPNQEVTIRYLYESARRYQEAGIEDHPFTGEVMERALEYLAMNSAGVVDVTV
ncbi:hypothetical protein [Kineococcus glutinatus]|uniref:Phage gp6-like head-tail connector protein n=1 Tax=Kineococcus glutinatus TaxID=1070872 RepID=A0ABP9HVX8_9ACTN